MQNTIIGRIDVPAISSKFYTELKRIYPPITTYRLRQVKSLEELNLLVGQQEVIQRMEQYVVYEDEVKRTKPKNLLDKLKDIIWAE